ncbi:hypothetical protein GQ607_003224 [Colletotrichum asianum]|uniref:Uncharacterized protein n=1 Tax=Colletotrichum asianum TaxID=702518 RepID=A0A8H3WJ72_9PEZI|nr:hypothetical protein GQ607_003224 [Colletotrichum asianum]
MIRGKQLTDLRWETTTARFPPPHPHYLKDAVSTDLGQSGASLPPKYPEWRPRNPASGVVPHCELDWEPKPCRWSLECWTTQSEYTTQAQAPSGKVRCSPEVQGVPRRPGSCPASCTTIAASRPVGSFNCSKHVLASNALQKPPFRPASACSFLLHQACPITRAQMLAVAVACREDTDQWMSDIYVAGASCARPLSFHQPNDVRLPNLNIKENPPAPAPFGPERSTPMTTEHLVGELGFLFPTAAGLGTYPMSN